MQGKNQKAKLLLLAKVLMQESDQEHPLTVKQLIAYLKENGISAERRTIYEDIEILQQFGMDIIVERKVQNQYYWGEREFQLPELKLLVDAAISAKFITPQKSQELIQKIGNLASKFQAKKLKRQLHVQGRAKAINEKIYYSVDALQTAIAEDKQIEFTYFQWKIEESAPNKIIREKKKDGKPYRVSPWAMVWDDENYYLIAYDKTVNEMRHYRVDKMENMQVLEESRLGAKVFGAIDMAKYTQTTFGMFGGKKIDVELRVDNKLIGVIIDRFGIDTVLYNVREGYFSVKIEVVPSPQFIGWLMGFGTQIEVVSPAELRQSIKNELESIIHLYKK